MPPSGRINVSEAIIKMLQWISFSRSPIDKRRFMAQCNERMISKQFRTSFVENRETSGRSWLAQLLHPIELAGLIKRYHMVGSGFFIIFFAHLFTLFHFTIKNAIHAVYTGNDRKLNEYFDSIYYPRIANVLQEPHLFNNLIVALCSYALSVRLLCAIRLIRSSCINATKYREVSVTQLNFTMFTLANLTLPEWIRFWRHTYEHERLLEANKISRRAHLDFNRAVHKQLENNRLSQFELMFHLNMFDFDECYEEVRDLLDIKRRKRCYRNWFMAPPYIRVSLPLARYGILLTIAGYVALILGSLLALLGMFYLELRKAPSEKAANNLLEIIWVWARHLSHPLHFLRATEMFFLVLLQFPHQFDAFAVTYDSATFVMKANKVIENLEKDLELSHNVYMASSAADPETILQENLDSRQVDLHVSSAQKSHQAQLASDSYDINGRLRCHTRLISLLYLELLDLRNTHTTFINLIVVGNGIALSYTISLFVAIQDLSGLLILAASTLSCVIPIIYTLGSCAGIEKVFKRLYVVICSLIVNKAGLLEPRTIQVLITASKLFERKGDRSFLFAGLYSITFDSVAPFLGYMATAILLLNKFIARE